MLFWKTLSPLCQHMPTFCKKSHIKYGILYFKIFREVVSKNNGEQHIVVTCVQSVPLFKYFEKYVTLSDKVKRA